MSKPSAMQNLYVGRAGQAMIMGEFLIRGYNVASPEVDRGDDLFVVRDEDGVLKRIQVKTANAVERNLTDSARVSPRATIVSSRLHDLT